MSLFIKTLERRQTIFASRRKQTRPHAGICHAPHQTRECGTRTSEKSNCMATYLPGFCSRSCSKPHIAFSFNFHVGFSPSVSLESRWCNPTVVHIRLQLEKKLRFILSVVRFSYTYIYDYEPKWFRRTWKFLLCNLFFCCSQPVSTLDQRQEKKVFVEKRTFFKKFSNELICYKRSDEKFTDDIAYPFVKWKLFSGIQVSSTVLLYICRQDTWH